MRLGLVFAAAGLLLPASLAAQSADAPPPATIGELLACRTMEDPQARLACYDQAAGALDSAVAAKSLVIVDAEEVRKTRRTLFGLTLPKISLFGGDDDEDAVKSISANLTRVDKLPFSRFRLTLEDGSVWETTETEKSLRPKVGTAVLVEKGAISGYRADIGSKKGVRVTRVQ